MPDPSRWLNENFAGWAELSGQEKKAIRDFPILWSMFELRATGQNGARPNATPERICNAVGELIVNWNPAELQQARDYFSGRYFVDGDQETYAFRQLRVPQDYQQTIRTALLNEDAEAHDILLGLLLIINRLRNNFLHGEKVRYAFEGQLENFRHANGVLMFALPLWEHP